ncbi:MAG: NAD-glutamate dehydrogenase, partial [Alphaproteobacteria bacterium]|nr:NAD-glutamate dehydrogenase [Alphaproteobacteria bacterium]
MSSRKKSSAKSARAANARAIKVSNMTAQQRPSKVKSGDDWASLLLAKLARDEEASFDDTLKARVRKAHAQMGQTRRHNEVKITVESLRPVKGQAPKTLVDIVADDNAFLIDSIVAKINEKSLLIDLLLHTTAHAQFDKSGQVVNISSKSMEDAVRVSHVHVQIKDILTAQECAQLESDLKTVIDHVSLVNRDWRAMLGRLNEARQELAQAHTPYSAFEVQQFCAFLDYLHDNNFTLLAYKSYQVASRKGDARGLAMKAVKDSGLGLLHDQIKSPLIDEINEGLPRNMQPVQYPLPAISVSKTDVSSTVHRHVPMDVIAVKIYDSKGHIKGEHVFLGLFTSVTYSRSLSDVPYLREKIDNVMAHTGFRAGSHDHKALRHILERYPRDEIFQMSVPELLHTGQSILRLQERQRIALYMRENLFGKTVSCLVYIPRDRFSTRLRRQIGGILERALDGKIANFYTTMDDSFYARVMFVISRQGKILHSVDHKAVEMMLQDAGQTWAERLNTALSESQREEDSLTRYTQRYGEAFPVSYTTR